MFPIGPRCARPERGARGAPFDFQRSFSACLSLAAAGAQAELNLGFETLDRDGAPLGWSAAPTPGHRHERRCGGREGERSLKVTRAAAAGVTRVTQRVPAALLRVGDAVGARAAAAAARLRAREHRGRGRRDLAAHRRAARPVVPRQLRLWPRAERGARRGCRRLWRASTRMASFRDRAAVARRRRRDRVRRQSCEGRAAPGSTRSSSAPSTTDSRPPPRRPPCATSTPRSR